MLAPFMPLDAPASPAPMRLATTCVGRPAFVRDGPELVRTGIFKQPVAGAVRASRLGLDGDGQADLEEHGGEFMAIYAYPADHYPAWRAELQRDDLAHGHFGENFTIEGFAEGATFLGDRWQVGSALFAVTQPRVPCFKLGIRLGDPGIVKRFTRSLRSGCYLRVLREGVVEAGDPVELVERGDARVPIDRLFEAMTLKKGRDGADILEHALESADLSPAWRAAIRERLDLAQGLRPRLR